MAKETASDNSAAVLAAEAIIKTVGIPGTHWIHGDDQCDCTFQTIWEVTNPYIAETQRVRLCCLLEHFIKERPDLIQRIPAYFDVGRFTYVSDPAEWDSHEMDMPVELWFRQLKKKMGRPMAWVRAHFSDRLDERPKRVKSRNLKEMTAEERRAGQERELKAAGWLLPDEKWEG